MLPTSIQACTQLVPHCMAPAATDCCIPSSWPWDLSGYLDFSLTKIDIYSRTEQGSLVTPYLPRTMGYLGSVLKLSLPLTPMLNDMRIFVNSVIQMETQHLLYSRWGRLCCSSSTQKINKISFLTLNPLQSEYSHWQLSGISSSLQITKRRSRLESLAPITGCFNTEVTHVISRSNVLAKATHQVIAPRQREIFVV